MKIQSLWVFSLMLLSLSGFAQHAFNFQTLFDKNANKEVACYRIPALVTAPNGDLLVAVDERVPSCADLRGSRDINIVLRRSRNNGKRWKPEEKIVDFPDGQSASDPSMIVDQQTGTIFLFYNFMDLNKEKEVYYLHLIKSEDNGKTWSKPVDITGQITKPAWHKDFMFITSGRGMQTQDGKLVHTLVNLERGLHLFASDDHGQSWHLIDQPILPGDESKVIELADGTWMINSRVNRSKLRYVHISKDQGKSWQSQPDSSLVDPSCNAAIIRYSFKEQGQAQDLLLFSNAADPDQRRNLTLKVSQDKGRSWSAGKIIYPGGAAYSTMTILKNGNIGIVFEKDGYESIAFVSIPISLN